MMLSLLLAAMPLAEEPGFERMLLCHAYHETWQWDEHNAGRKVPVDFVWYQPFREKLLAAGAVKGLNRDRVIDQSQALVRSMGAGLTPEQNADWAKCQKELGWAPDPSGKMIN